MHTDFHIGDRITWKAEGKGARLDGVDGKWVTGTVTDFAPDDLLRVDGDYPSGFAGHLVDIDEAKRLSDGYKPTATGLLAAHVEAML